MKLQHQGKIQHFLACFLIIPLLVGCGQSPFARGAPTLSNPNYIRPTNQVRLPKYTGKTEVVSESDNCKVRLDLSNISAGYVGAVCESPVKAKILITNGEKKFHYTLSNNGDAQYFPLTMGSGTYTVEIFKHVEGTTYSRVLSEKAEVQFDDELVPFLIPSPLVGYDEQSSVTQLAHNLAKHASSDLEVVQQVYHWVQTNIKYDTEKAEKLKATTGEPSSNLDQVLQEKKGICLDYASLVAALLRANGIPCKLVIGYVDANLPEPVLHAWNMVWLNEDGEIAQHVPTNSGNWTRLDLTIVSQQASAFKIVKEDSRYNAQSEH